jgi:phosphatidylglycerophosphate synthase
MRSNLKESIKSTYKSSETEEFIDIYFYRPIGYLIAKAAFNLQLTPNQITIASIFVGAAAGHLFYYSNLWINIAGILLLISANAMDSADGQLARMSDTRSFNGRILDGIAGNLWFVSIYLNIYFRLINEGYSPLIILLLVITGISHSFQSAYADYFRNHYLYFVFGKNKSEIDNAHNLKLKYRTIPWKNYYDKFLMRVYLNYTIQQELLSKPLIRLYKYVSAEFPGSVPLDISKQYRNKINPLVKYFNILTTNTRMIVLFAAILIGEPVLYFYFELTILNLLFIYMLSKQNKESDAIYNSIKANKLTHIEYGK